MKGALALIWLAVIVAAQEPGTEWRVWYFGALACGTEQWSMLTMTNPASTAQSLKFEAYDSQGTAMPVPASIEFQPNERRVLRLEAPSVRERLCWVRATAFSKAAADIGIQAVVEHAAGTQIERAGRDEVYLSGSSWWHTRPGKFHSLYLVNVSSVTSEISICWADRLLNGICEETPSVRKFGVMRVKLLPKQALDAAIGKPLGKYLIFQMSEPALYITTFLKAPKGKAPATNNVLRFDGVTAAPRRDKVGQ